MTGGRGQDRILEGGPALTEGVQGLRVTRQRGLEISGRGPMTKSRTRRGVPLPGGVSVKLAALRYPYLKDLNQFNC
jgi:hypothetical protein